MDGWMLSVRSPVRDSSTCTCTRTRTLHPSITTNERFFSYRHVCARNGTHEVEPLDVVAHAQVDEEEVVVLSFSFEFRCECNVRMHCKEPAVDRHGAWLSSCYGRFPFSFFRCCAGAIMCACMVSKSHIRRPTDVNIDASDAQGGPGGSA